MPNINIIPILKKYQINTPMNVLLISNYLENCDEPDNTLLEIDRLVEAVSKDSFINAQIIPTLLQLKPKELIDLYKTVMFIKFGSKKMSMQLIDQLVQCTMHNSVATYNVTITIIGCFDLTSMHDILCIYQPQTITNLDILFKRWKPITNNELLLILRNTYLANEKYQNVILPLIHILKGFDYLTTELALATLRLLDINDAICLNSVNAVLKNGPNMSIRAKVYILCHRNQNQIANIDTLLVSQSNLGKNHLQVLEFLEEHGLLNTDVLVEWHRIKPSNAYAEKQLKILSLIAKYKLLNSNIVANILKLNLKQLKSLTVNDWANQLSISITNLTYILPNVKLFKYSPLENNYLEDLLILSSIFNICEEYSVTTNQKIQNIFDVKLSEDSLLVNRIALKNLSKILFKLHDCNLLSSTMLNNILYRQLPQHDMLVLNSYLVGIAQVIDILESVKLFNGEQINKLFDIDDLTRTTLADLLAIFIPEVTDASSILHEEINIMEISICLENNANKHTVNKIKILPEIIKIYSLLKRTNNFSNEIFKEIIRVALTSTTNIYAKLNELYLILEYIVTAKSQEDSYETMLKLVTSKNMFYLTSLQSMLYNLQYNKYALGKLYNSKYFIEQLISSTDLDSYLKVVVILSNKLKLLCDRNLNTLSEIEITESLKNLLSLAKRCLILDQNIFVSAIKFSEFFVDENGAVLEEVNHIQREQMNLNNWNDLIEICESKKTKNERKLAVKSYLCNNILAHDPNFNFSQSTHTASVHLSTDITFWLLTCKYPDANYAKLEEQLYNDINEYKQSEKYKQKISSDIWSIQKGISGVNILFSTLAISNIELSAERKKESMAFMEKLQILTENSEIKHLEETLREDLDKDTEESIPRFILLLYYEIMQNRPASIRKEAALEAFLKACYESVRGYNLDSRGSDINKRTKNSDICAGGVANKFCEILIGQSKIILFYYVAPESIDRKIQAELIRHVRNKYNLLKITDPITTRRDFQSLADDENVSDVLTTTWEESKDEVLRVIIEDFFGFINSDKLATMMHEFETSALPYIPSPKHYSARRFYSSEFIEWFNATSLNLSAAQQGKRKFGEFNDNAESQDISQNESNDQNLEQASKRINNGKPVVR